MKPILFERGRQNASRPTGETDTNPCKWNPFYTQQPFRTNRPKPSTNGPTSQTEHCTPRPLIHIIPPPPFTRNVLQDDKTQTQNQPELHPKQPTVSIHQGGHDKTKKVGKIENRQGETVAQHKKGGSVIEMTRGRGSHNIVARVPQQLQLFSVIAAVVAVVGGCGGGVLFCLAKDIARVDVSSIHMQGMIFLKRKRFSLMESRYTDHQLPSRSCSLSHTHIHTQTCQMMNTTTTNNYSDYPVIMPGTIDTSYSNTTIVVSTVVKLLYPTATNRMAAHRTVIIPATIVTHHQAPDNNNICRIWMRIMELKHHRHPRDIQC